MAKDTMQKSERQGERETTQSQNRGEQSGSRGTRAASSRGSNGDSERSLSTSREDGRDEGTSTGMARRTATSTGGGSGSVRSHPLMLMQRMSEDMDRLFEQFGLGRGLGGFSLSPFQGELLGDGGTGRSSLIGTDRTVWAPQVEVRRKGDKLVVCADLPGVNRDDLTVEMRDGALALSGERRAEDEEEGEGFYRSERSYGRFYRTIPLPDGVNAEQAKASFKDGVLEVTVPLPKEEKQSPRRIEIR